MHLSTNSKGNNVEGFVVVDAAAILDQSQSSNNFLINQIAPVTRSTNQIESSISS